MGDNGGIESKEENRKEEVVVKTDEQLRLERAERFAKNQDSFVEVGELICAVIRNPKSQLGVSVMVGVARRSEMDIAQVELNHIVDLTRRQMDMEAQKTAQSKIVKPGGIMNFARRRR